MRSLHAVLGVILCSSLIFISCKKGDTGPAGAQGPAGTANVKYSSWNELSMSFVFSDSLYEQTIKADSITQGVLDSGVVMTYMKYVNSSNQTTVVNAETYMGVEFNLGKINLYSNYDFSGFSFRYVIIPGGVKAGQRSGSAISGYTKEQLKNMSYEHVLQLAGQKE